MRDFVWTRIFRVTASFIFRMNGLTASRLYDAFLAIHLMRHQSPNSDETMRRLKSCSLWQFNLGGTLLLTLEVLMKCLAFGVGAPFPPVDPVHRSFTFFWSARERVFNRVDAVVLSLLPPPSSVPPAPLLDGFNCDVSGGMISAFCRFLGRKSTAQ